MFLSIEQVEFYLATLTDDELEEHKARARAEVERLAAVAPGSDEHLGAFAAAERVDTHLQFRQAGRVLH